MPPMRCFGIALLFRCGLMFGIFGEEALGFERGHATLTGRGDGLAIDVIGHIARREQAWHRSRC